MMKVKIERMTFILRLYRIKQFKNIHKHNEPLKIPLIIEKPSDFPSASRFWELWKAFARLCKGFLPLPKGFGTQEKRLGRQEKGFGKREKGHGRLEKGVGKLVKRHGRLVKRLCQQVKERGQVTRSGSQKFIDLHLEVERDMLLQEAHDVTVRVLRDIEAEVPRARVHIHTDPADQI